MCQANPMTEPPNADHRVWVRSLLDRFEAPPELCGARLLGDPAAARDVVQETFLGLSAEKREDLESHQAEWLFTVCRNRALGVLRKDRLMTQLKEEQVQRCLSPAPG